MNAIVAVYNDWGIGVNGLQPISIPADRRRFAELTTGGIVIVGRRTFEAIGHPLPNRRNIVLTRDTGYRADGCEIAHDADEAMLLASGDLEKTFVIGGGEVYALLLPHCTKAYVTKIDAAPHSDTFFPNLDEAPGWSVAHIEPPRTCETTGTTYSYIIYEKVMRE
jgi:dihydrofolate reductase